MPKKPNSSGELQEYVPAGNGDASGEYGDADGNNRHFTSWKNPHTEESGIAVVAGEKPAEVETKQDEFAEYLQKNHNDDFRKRVERDYNAGSAEHKALINTAISKYGVELNETSGTSYYRPSSTSVNLNAPQQYGKYSSKEEGETLYHEFWHANDNVVCGDGFLTDEDKAKALEYADRTTRTYVSRWEARVNIVTNASTCKYLSNGMTLHQTILAEFKKMKRSGVFDEMRREYNKHIMDKVLEKVPEYEKADEWLTETDRRIDKEAYEKFPDTTYGYDTWSKMREYRKQQYDLLKEERDKYQAIKSEGDRVKLDASHEVATYFMSLSDMYGIAHNDGYGFCGGHGTSYCKRKFSEAHEFMAEYGSAKARTSENAKKELDLFKKYMPKSSQACEELQDLIIKHMGAKQ